MKQTRLALSAVMIVAVGLIGTNFVTGIDMTGEEKFNALSNYNAIYGHITIVHSDLDGNILSYVQTDNEVATLGKDCLAELAFGEHGTACGSTNAIFDVIALFNNETFPPNMNASGLLGAGTLVTANGLTVTNGGQGVVTTVSANAIDGGDGAKTNIAKTFTAGIGVAGEVVSGAALLNNGTGGTSDGVLAGQVFADVTLNESDTLLITWTIELG